ncbi:hypothetical protein PBI_SCTP2_162 [Salicola phage SCTP-2]|nr:hypothetical protein PBI_SCTP2_162 [Salicola phage SCTP-2]
MSEVLSNITGTTNTFYKIGKRGICLFQGNSMPDSTLGNNGDVYFTKTSPPSIYRKENGLWYEIGIKKIETVSSDTVLINSTAEQYYLADSQSSQLTLTISSSNTIKGYCITIKDKSGTSETNNITIDTEGNETIDGDTVFTINNNYNSITMICDGSNWFII